MEVHANIEGTTQLKNADRGCFFDPFSVEYAEIMFKERIESGEILHLAEQTNQGIL